MSARCETIGKFVMPVFRSLVAKELVNTYHLTQVDAAKKLGTTQAAISQYLTSKRAIKGSEQFVALLPKIQAKAKDTAERLVKNEVSWKNVTADFCKLCLTFCKEDQASQDYNI